MKREFLLDKFAGSILSAALGDALGASFHPGAEDKLRYTDDTVMMTAIAEILIELDGKINPEELAWRFVEKYEEEPWREYGPGPPKIFKLIKRGMGPLELDRKIYHGGSYGNGAAMRIAPVGLFFYDNLDGLRCAVEEACKPTHNHPLAVEGALLEAAAVAKAVALDPGTEVDRRDFVEYLSSIASEEVYLRKLRKLAGLLEAEPPRRRVVKELGNSVEAFNSVPTAIYCYLKEQDPIKSIRAAIRLGGDTDTIACMAGAIAGAHRGAEALPEAELSRLENAAYIRGLSEKLWEVKLGGSGI